jgi:hypothetical protein
MTLSRMSSWTLASGSTTQLPPAIVGAGHLNGLPRDWWRRDGVKVTVAASQRQSSASFHARVQRIDPNNFVS